jgi:hypothetical protein
MVGEPVGGNVNWKTNDGRTPSGRGTQMSGEGDLHQLEETIS